MGGIHISGIEYYLPENCITNQDLAQKSGVSAGEIYKRTGIQKRYHTTAAFLMSDMAAAAADKVFFKNPAIKDKIGALILVGHGFEYKAPITAAILQNRLGLPKSCLSIDLPHGCSGYINGLAVGKGLMEAGIADSVLLLTADTPSYVIHPDNDELLSIFCDSGTASLLENKSFDREKFVFGTDGSGADALIVKNSGTVNPSTAEMIRQTGMIYGTMEMKSTEIFTFALRTVPPLVTETLQKNNLKLDEIDFFVFHQANSFLLEVLRKRIKIPKEKFFNDIENTGNTVSSSIPIALKTAEERGQLKRGMKVLLAGFGLGYTWGATVITY
jgi:3-oxoacyl-[acyl-carrier-protein] synthase III